MRTGKNGPAICRISGGTDILTLTFWAQESNMNIETKYSEELHIDGAEGTYLPGLSHEDAHAGEVMSTHAADAPKPIEAEADSTGFSWRLAIGESLQIVLPALVLATVVHFFLAQATVVYGQSMEPDLYQHQRLVVDKVSFRLHPPQRGDIVVLDLPQMDEMLVKRVVGMPGERIEIFDGIVYVNDEPLPEPFPHDLTAYDMPEITLAPLHYFVLGDNRGNSNDSRSFGGIHRDYIVGRVWLRYWPINQMTIF